MFATVKSCFIKRMLINIHIKGWQQVSLSFFHIIEIYDVINTGLLPTTLNPAAGLHRGCCPTCFNIDPNKTIRKAAQKHNKGSIFHCQTATGSIYSFEMHSVVKANRLSKVIQEPSPAQICHQYFLFSHLHLSSTAESSNITGTNGTKLQLVNVWTWQTWLEHGVSSTRCAS